MATEGFFNGLLGRNRRRIEFPIANRKLGFVVDALRLQIAVERRQVVTWDIRLKMMFEMIVEVERRDE